MNFISVEFIVREAETVLDQQVTIGMISIAIKYLLSRLNSPPFFIYETEECCF